jgi:REP element-mobilizing transposase RayT
MSGMGYPPRKEEAGAVHHVYSRGIARRAIFLDNEDRRTYLAMLGTVALRCRWHCLAFCLMDNHVHQLIETPVPNLGDGMRRLLGPYARRFNERHETSGHVFERRYGSRRIRDEVHLITTVRYIARNPIEAGMCETEHEWPWSSQAMLVAGTAPAWLDALRAKELLGDVY